MQIMASWIRQNSNASMLFTNVTMMPVGQNDRQWQSNVTRYCHSARYKATVQDLIALWYGSKMKRVFKYQNNKSYIKYSSSPRH